MLARPSRVLMLLLLLLAEDDRDIVSVHLLRVRRHGCQIVPAALHRRRGGAAGAL